MEVRPGLTDTAMQVSKPGNRSPDNSDHLWGPSCFFEGAGGHDSISILMNPKEKHAIEFIEASMPTEWSPFVHRSTLQTSTRTLSRKIVTHCSLAWLDNDPAWQKAGVLQVRRNAMGCRDWALRGAGNRGVRRAVCFPLRGEGSAC